MSVKVGDRVRVTMNSVSKHIDDTWNGEYEVAEVFDLPAEKIAIRKSLLGIDYTGAIAVKHPVHGLGDIMANEYEVINNGN